jgi:hypothetical protein
MRGSRTALGVGLAALVAACCCLLTPATASAYCVARGCDEKPDFNEIFEGPTECVFEGHCLVSGGLELYWPKSCISYAVQRDGSTSDGIDFETANEIVNVAFDTWLGADCGGGVGPSLAVENLGPVDCRKAEYNQEQGNANVILFRDEDWPHKASIYTALALTTLSYDTRSGEIYDADIEVNAFGTRLTVSDDVVDDDFQSIIVHEIGHFLGLSHSNTDSATMWPNYDTGSTTLRDLDADDAAGICALFPPNEAVDANDCAPRHGFSSACAKPVDAGCVTSGPARRSNGGGWALVALASASAFRRARKRRQA